MLFIVVSFVIFVSVLVNDLCFCKNVVCQGSSMIPIVDSTVPLLLLSL